MSKQNREWVKSIFVCLFLLIIGGLTIITVVQFCNIKVDDYRFDGITIPTGINPSNQTHSHIIHLLYPLAPSPMSYTNVGGGNNNSALLSVDLYLTYSGTLGERTKVSVYATGNIYPQGKKDLKDSIDICSYPVGLGFEGASLYNESEARYDLPQGEFLLPLNSSFTEITTAKWDPDNPWTLYQNITWDMQGDYYPYIILYFNNGTVSTPTYPDYRIHVNGPEVFEQENYARISTWLALLLFAFTVTISLPILYALFPENWLKWLHLEDEPSNSEISTFICQPIFCLNEEKTEKEQPKNPQKNETCIQPKEGNSKKGAVDENHSGKTHKKK
jgi:hypothetical protein